MKKILLAGLMCLSLTACELPQKTGEESRIVYISGERVDEDDGTLYFTVKDDATAETWEVYVGESCNNYPFNFGERFLARFDRYAWKSQPNKSWISLHDSYGLARDVCANPL